LVVGVVGVPAGIGPLAPTWSIPARRSPTPGSTLAARRSVVLLV
jgi:hypothetical protein